MDQRDTAPEAGKESIYQAPELVEIGGYAELTQGFEQHVPEGDEEYLF
ncbi:lasso RiPP family leader peptide-containing protein [Streptomyces sp. NPDC052236]